MNEYSLPKNALTCSVYECFVVLIAANVRIPMCQCSRLNLVNFVCSYVNRIVIINFDPLFCYFLNMFILNSKQ